MMLLHPMWLVLTIPLAASMWLWRMPSRTLIVLRACVLTLVVLGMCNLTINLDSKAGTIVIVADRSRSMPNDTDKVQKEAIELLQGEMKHNDRLAVVSFGRNAAIEQPPQSGKFAGFGAELDNDGSNLREALDTALALIPRDAPGRILILSDGVWTGQSPTAVISRAAARGIGIDYRILQRSSANDLAVARIEAPPEVTPGESFMINAWVYCPTKQEVRFKLVRGLGNDTTAPGEVSKPRVLASGKRVLGSGVTRLTFRDSAPAPGAMMYRLKVTPIDPTADPADPDKAEKKADPTPENNIARILVGVRGPKPILCLSPTPNSALAELIRGGRLNVKTPRPGDCDWSLEQLASYSSILIENVPASEIGERGMENIAAWVSQTGAGMIMTGGRNSYGPGGYFRSPLEPIMPVSMELRQEHRKLSLAIVAVLDRSGSMAVSVSGGKTKMDLANLATAETLNLLSAMDEFGVLAVDSTAHLISDLAPVTDKAKVRSKILRIESMGGGIYVYEGLSHAAKLLTKARSGTRHIILFADAADSEEPGAYKKLIAKLRKANTTVSVIGLGSKGDCDAPLLQDIAKRGGGRCFFTTDAKQLPRLFAQDTFMVARSSFLDEPAAVRSTGAMVTLTGKQYRSVPNIGGYNLCYLRPQANLAMVTEDEYKAPVVASWRSGIGRVACYTGEADGKYTGPIARWDKVGDMFTSLVRWTAGEDAKLPPNMLLTQEISNGACHVRLHLDTDSDELAINSIPIVTTLRGAPGQSPTSSKTKMQWDSPDTLIASIPLQGSETAINTVEIPGAGSASLAPACLPYSPEYQPLQDDRGIRSLRELAQATRATERINLAGIWRDLPSKPRMVNIGPWLLLAAMAVMLLEIVQRRTGILAWPSLAMLKKQKQQSEDEAEASQPAPAKKREKVKASAGETPAEPQTPQQEPPRQNSVLDAMKKARHKARRRTRDKRQS